MFSVKIDKLCIFNNIGYILIELIILISFLILLAGIAMPLYNQLLHITKKEVCNKNCKQVEKYYLMSLVTNSQTTFEQFLNEDYKMICPLNG